jgi:hypothetical protein
MTTTKISYDSSTAASITLNSLAASTTAGRQSAAIDNTSNLYDGAKLTLIISTSATGLSNSKACYVYFFGSEDGVNFDQDDGVIGVSDAAYTINSPTNLKGPYVINTPTASKVYNVEIPVEQFFGGALPRKWGFVVTNDTGQALKSTGNSASYSGFYYTNS